jgi:hypothetical protein
MIKPGFALRSGYRSWLLLAASALSGSGLAAELQVAEPDVACRLMADHGLATRGGYKTMTGGTFRCASFRVPLPFGGAANHEVRYFAQGLEDRVQSLNLQLYIRSRENTQAAHRRLLDYAQDIADRALGRAIPDAVARNILSATTGRIVDGNVEWVLEKAQIRGSTYEYFVRLDVSAS